MVRAALHPRRRQTPLPGFDVDFGPRRESGFTRPVRDQHHEGQGAVDGVTGDVALDVAVSLRPGEYGAGPGP